jgi:hypothetical protein
VSAPASSPPSATQAPGQAASPPQPLPADACPLCGAPLADDQEWCLSCGAAARTRLAAAPGWRGPVAVVAVIAALALGVLAAALVKLAGDSGPAPAPATTTVTGAAAAPTVASTPTLPTTAPTAGVTPTSTATPVAPGATAPQSGSASGQPAGTASTPTTSAGKGRLRSLAPQK